MSMTNKEIMDKIYRGPYKVCEVNKNHVHDANGKCMVIVQNEYPNPNIVAEAIARVLNSPLFKNEISNKSIRDIL